jgi:hypothetical protein
MTIFINNELVYYVERTGLTLYHLYTKSNIVFNDVANFFDHLEIIPIAHRRMGKINMRTLRRMHHKNIVDGLNLTDVTQVQKTPPICSGWAKGKIHRLSFSDGRKKNMHHQRINYIPIFVAQCFIHQLEASNILSYSKTTSVVLLQSTS